MSCCAEEEAAALALRAQTTVLRRGLLSLREAEEWLRGGMGRQEDEEARWRGACLHTSHLMRSSGDKEDALREETDGKWQVAIVLIQDSCLFINW